MENFGTHIKNGIVYSGNVIKQEIPKKDVDYNEVINKPKINNKEIVGNVTLDQIGAQPKGTYVNSVNGKSGAAIVYGSDIKLSSSDATTVASALGGLRFGIDGDGNYGYYGADGSLVPFKKGADFSEFLNSNYFTTSEDYKINDYADLSLTLNPGIYLIVLEYTYSSGVSQDNTLRIDDGGKLYLKFVNLHSNASKSLVYRTMFYMAEVTSNTLLHHDSYSKIVNSDLIAIKLA